MCKSILAFLTVRATVAVHPSQGGCPVDRLLTDRVCDIRRGHVVDPFFRLRSWWGDAHHSRLLEPLGILIGEPQHLRQTAGIHAYSLQASLEKVDFDRDYEEDVVRVFVCLGERKTPKCGLACFGVLFLVTLPFLNPSGQPKPLKIPHWWSTEYSYILLYSRLN